MNPRQLREKQAYNAGRKLRKAGKKLYVPMVFLGRNDKKAFILGYRDEMAMEKS